MIVDLTREEIKAGLADDSILLIDVREPHEFAAGHIPGSILMPLSTFNPAELPDSGDKEIVFSCAAGVRSRHALLMAQAAGMPVEAHYIGGFKDWAMAGEEIAD
ncbi:MAG: rhodanese-like domain-containing protein [Rhabdaerophilum sp.]